jgi:peptide/nickel transport system substrate-binding protein
LAEIRGLINQKINQKTGSHEMKKRLSFAGSLGVMIVATMAAAETPKDTVVMAKQIDDIVSLDPGELFEISSGEVAANIYDTLLASDPDDTSKIV